MDGGAEKGTGALAPCGCFLILIRGGRWAPTGQRQLSTSGCVRRARLVGLLAGLASPDSARQTLPASERSFHSPRLVKEMLDSTSAEIAGKRIKYYFSCLA